MGFELAADALKVKGPLFDQFSLPLAFVEDSLLDFGGRVPGSIRVARGFGVLARHSSSKSCCVSVPCRFFSAHACLSASEMFVGKWSTITCLTSAFRNVGGNSSMASNAARTAWFCFLSTATMRKPASSNRRACSTNLCAASGGSFGSGSRKTCIETFPCISLSVGNVE